MGQENSITLVSAGHSASDCSQCLPLFCIKIITNNLNCRKRKPRNFLFKFLVLLGLPIEISPPKHLRFYSKFIYKRHFHLLKLIPSFFFHFSKHFILPTSPPRHTSLDSSTTGSVIPIMIDDIRYPRFLRINKTEYKSSHTSGLYRRIGQIAKCLDFDKSLREGRNLANLPSVSAGYLELYLPLLRRISVLRRLGRT